MLSEQLRSCHFPEGYGDQNKEMCQEFKMSGRKSDTAIVSEKSVKADGEKGCALYSFKRLGTMQTKES